jgi:hypothetical protein
MYKLSILSSLFGILLLSQPVWAQIKYETYINSRYSYSIGYPKGILTPQPEADNGDGRVFTTRDGAAELRVWGMYNALSDTLKKAYLNDLKERGSGVTYKVLMRDGYVISGVHGNKVYYQKTILQGSDGDTGATFSTFTVEYKKSQKAKYDPIVRRIASSFRFV